MVVSSTVPFISIQVEKAFTIFFVVSGKLHRLASNPNFHGTFHGVNHNILCASLRMHIDTMNDKLRRSCIKEFSNWISPSGPPVYR